MTIRKGDEENTRRAQGKCQGNLSHGAQAGKTLRTKAGDIQLSRAEQEATTIAAIERLFHFMCCIDSIRLQGGDYEARGFERDTIKISITRS